MIRLVIAQFGNELRALPIRHLAVVERDLYQHRRVIRLVNVVVGRIFLHVIVSGLFVGIAPFDIFGRRQRQRCVKHRVQHIDEWNLRYDCFEQIRSHVTYGAHQHAAGAATLNHQTILRSKFVVDEMFRTGNEVGERIYLVHHAAGVAPGFT